MAKTPRTWTGARTPSGLKRVRQAQSRHEVLQPRRSAAKTYVAKALSAAAEPAGSTIDPVAALAGGDEMVARVRKILTDASGHRGHIFSLGHGVLRETPPENLRRIVEVVHSETRRNSR